ncbi:hypothetical protein [Candidatus Hodgkinia cicadicola]|uniref:hypothetical protein n=1 Tax=Candidatus Hodgkinia cicadicola TaxID=573658 RepID=UPI0011BA5101
MVYYLSYLYLLIHILLTFIKHSGFISDFINNLGIRFEINNKNKVVCNWCTFGCYGVEDKVLIILFGLLSLVN